MHPPPIPPPFEGGGQGVGCSHRADVGRAYVPADPLTTTSDVGGASPKVERSAYLPAPSRQPHSPALRALVVGGHRPILRRVAVNALAELPGCAALGTLLHILRQPRVHIAALHAAEVAALTQCASSKGCVGKRPQNESPHPCQEQHKQYEIATTFQNEFVNHGARCEHRDKGSDPNRESSLTKAANVLTLFSKE